MTSQAATHTRSTQRRPLQHRLASHLLRCIAIKPPEDRIASKGPPVILAQNEKHKHAPQIKRALTRRCNAPVQTKMPAMAVARSAPMQKMRHAAKVTDLGPPPSKMPVRMQIFFQAHRLSGNLGPASPNTSSWMSTKTCTKTYLKGWMLIKRTWPVAMRCD